MTTSQATIQNYKYLPLVFILFFLLSCSEKPPSVNSYLGFDIKHEVVDNYLKAQMDSLQIHGLAIAMINDGEIVYHRTIGYADISKKLPVTDKTIFEGASISKSVFAFFVMTFVEDQLLDLDKPLFEYYPHPDVINDNRYQKITARMVLSHRSGFPNWREDEENQELKTKFDPGTDYLYSGEGYQYLAMVLMHLTNTDHQGLEEIFQKRVAKPLNLEHTGFIQTLYTRMNKAEPYDKNGNWIDWNKNYWVQKEDGKFYAPASLHSEPIDFSKWMMGIMDKRVLSKSSYGELLKPHSNIPNDGLQVSYTLGFLTPDIPFTNLYAHSGNNEGFTSWYALDTEKKWGFVVFANSDNGEKLGENLFFYLLTGPDLHKLYILILITFVFLIATIIFGIKGIRYLIRSRLH